jgi:hypothetical protein
MNDAKYIGLDVASTYVPRVCVKPSPRSGRSETSTLVHTVTQLRPCLICESLRRNVCFHLLNNSLEVCCEADSGEESIKKVVGP